MSSTDAVIHKAVHSKQLTRTFANKQTSQQAIKPKSITLTSLCIRGPQNDWSFGQVKRYTRGNNTISLLGQRSGNMWHAVDWMTFTFTVHKQSTISVQQQVIEAFPNEASIRSSGATVISCIRDHVCPTVGALKGKRLELSTPKSVIYGSNERHWLWGQKVKGQATGSSSGNVRPAWVCR